MRIEKIKTHFRENKNFYIGAGCGVIIAGITCVIMRRRHANVQRVLDGQDTVTVRPLNFISRNNNSNNVVAVFAREGRGHTGYPVQCLETNEIFPSQNDAAKAFGVTKSIMSGHIVGKLSDINGFHFKRLDVAPLIVAA